MIILEDKRGRQAKNRTLGVIREVFGNAEWLDKPLGREFNFDGPCIEYLEKSLVSNFFHGPMKDHSIRTLEPLVAKIAFGELGFEGNSPDNNRLGTLRQCLEFMYTKYKNGAVPNPGNVDFQWFEDNIGEEVKAMQAKENADVESGSYDRNANYDIVAVEDFSTAKSYGDCSCSSSKLCYTQSGQTWQQYTNNGENKVYVLLRKGWKQEKEEPGGERPI